MRAWFRVTNERDEHVGVGIVVQLIYGPRNDGIDRRDRSLNNLQLVSVIYAAFLRADYQTVERPLNTTPAVYYGLFSHSTVQVNLVPALSGHFAGMGHIQVADGLNDRLTIPQSSLLNDEDESSDFVPLTPLCMLR